MRRGALGGKRVRRKGLVGGDPLSMQSGTDHGSSTRARFRVKGGLRRQKGDGGCGLRVGSPHARRGRNSSVRSNRENGRVSVGQRESSYVRFRSPPRARDPNFSEERLPGSWSV